jgi:uncharacterized protein (TIGR03118 family)
MGFLKVKILTSNTVDPSLQNPIGLTNYKNELWTVTNFNDLLKHFSKNGFTLVPTNINILPDEASHLTGLVYNESKGFVITNPSTGITAGSQFIVNSQAGIIYGYNQFVNPTSMIEGYVATDGASYTGLAYNSNLIYNVDFFNNKIDVIDFTWKLLDPASYPFIDATLPAGYTVYNIANIAGELYVTYTIKDTMGSPGFVAGFGIVNVFSYTGVFKRRLVSPGGRLNGPYGLTFAQKGNHLRIFVGNRGDGKINEYSSTGKFLGTLSDKYHNPLVIPNLWSLSNDNTDRSIYFTAGVNTTGTLGKIIKDNSDPHDPCKPKKDNCRRECSDPCEDLCRRSPCRRSRSNSADSRSSRDNSVSSRSKHHQKKHEKGCGCGK